MNEMNVMSPCFACAISRLCVSEQVSLMLLNLHLGGKKLNALLATKGIVIAHYPLTICAPMKLETKSVKIFQAWR